MKICISQLLLIGCLLAIGFNPSLSAQIKKEGQKQPTRHARLSKPKQTIRVKLITAGGSEIRGFTQFWRGDTLAVRDLAGSITLFSLKTLQYIRFTDIDGEVLSREEVAVLLNVGSIKNSLDSDNIVIETQSGDIIQGKLRERQGDTILVDMGMSNLMKLTLSQIKSLKKASEISVLSTKLATLVDVNAPYENPHASHGIMSMNGMPLKQGENYYHTVYGLINNFGVRLYDNFNLQIGVPSLPLATYINPNVIFPINDYLFAGAGVVFWVIPNNFSTTAFGTLAIGDRDRNIGIRIGKHLNNNNFLNFDKQSVPFSIAGQVRFHNNWSFMGELVAFSPQDNTNLLGIGMRYFRPRFALDFGLGGAGRIVKDANSRDFLFGVPYITLSFVLY